MVVLALARDPMMGHARPPVNKRPKLRATTPLDGSARPPERGREFGYTAPAHRPQRPAAHFIKCLLATLIAYTNASRRHVPSPGTRRPRQSPRQGTIEVAMTPLTDLLPPPTDDAAPDPDAIFSAFATWATEQGISLYPHQEEALIEVAMGSNVILSTPTGSGKSLVAAGAHFFALANGQRSYYTAPIKALVSEKFLALIDFFGPAKGA